jgi:hypothetical protein
MKVKREKDILSDMFSFSKLMAFAKCPRYAFYRYVARLREPSEDFFIKGRAVHDGQEFDNRERCKGKRWTIPVILDRAVTRYEEEGGAEVDAFRIEHEKQLEKYWKIGARDRLHPLRESIEAPFEIDVEVTSDPGSEPKRPATVQGFVDVVSEEDLGQPEPDKVVVDYKTVARPVSDTEARESLQNHLYIVGAEVGHARNVSFVKEGRQKAGAKETCVVEGSTRMLKYLLTVLSDNITSFRKNLKSGDWPKCAPNCFWCKEGSCGFYDKCYPKKNPDLHKFVEITRVRPVGTLEMPEWRKRKK